MEYNALANIRMKLDGMYDNGDLSDDDYQFFVNQLHMFQTYIECQLRGDKIAWHEVVTAHKKTEPRKPIPKFLRFKRK